MIAALLLSLAAEPDAATLMTNAAARLSAVPPAKVDPNARFRVSGSGDVGPDGKTRAMQDTGTICDLVGDRRCTSKPRTLLKADLEP